MVWPSALAALRQWNSLDAARRESTCYLLFALATVAGDDWFVRQAIEMIPELEQELGDLLASIPDSANAEYHAQALRTEPRCASVEVPGETIDVDATWQAIGSALSRLYSDWPQDPSRACLSQLAAIAKDASGLLTALPEDAKPPEVELQAALDALRQHLLDLSHDAALSWVGSDEIEQLMARWSIARAQATDNEAVADLAEDGARALERLDVGLVEMRAAVELVLKAKQFADQLGLELENIRSGVRRLGLRNRHLQAMEDSIAAERKRADVMLSVLASASPRGAEFDPATNYVAATDGSSERLSEEAPDPVDDTTGAAPAPQHPPAADRELPVLEPEPIAEPAPIAFNPAAGASDATVPDQWNAIAEPQHPAHTNAAEAAGTGEAIVDLLRPGDSPDDEALPQPVSPLDFTDSAGNRCRPIWSLLCLSMPSLAFHFASALQATSRNCAYLPRHCFGP